MFPISFPLAPPLTPCSRGIRFELLARLCPSTTGAEIRSVCTEAGMFAIRGRRKSVSERDFLDAVQKVSGSVMVWRPVTPTLNSCRSSKTTRNSLPLPNTCRITFKFSINPHLSACPPLSRQGPNNPSTIPFCDNAPTAVGITLRVQNGRHNISFSTLCGTSSLGADLPLRKSGFMGNVLRRTNTFPWLHVPEKEGERVYRKCPTSSVAIGHITKTTPLPIRTGKLSFVERG